MPPSSPSGEKSAAISPNNHIIERVIAAIDGEKGSLVNSKSELDSHTNMVVLGKHSFVFEGTGRTCNVKPFHSKLGLVENVPIVDGAVAYDCPYTRTTYILIARNALHLPSMEYNLIPSFIMRAGGVTVNDTAKIY